MVRRFRKTFYQDQKIPTGRAAFPKAGEQGKILDEDGQQGSGRVLDSSFQMSKNAFVETQNQEAKIGGKPLW